MSSSFTHEPPVEDLVEQDATDYAEPMKKMRWRSPQLEDWLRLLDLASRKARNSTLHLSFEPDMRLRNMFTSLGIALAIPFFSIVISYWSILSHLDDLRLELDHHHRHLQGTGVSIGQAMLATACLPLPQSTIAFKFFCASPKVATSALEDLLSRQRLLYTEAVRLSPSADSFIALSNVAEAVEVALAYDDYVLLTEDGNLSINGIGDVRLIAEIGKAARALSVSLYRMLTHVELSIARATLIHRVVLSGLSLLQEVVTGSLRWEDVPIGSYGYVAAVSSEAIDSSMGHLGEQLRNSIASMTRVIELADTLADGKTLDKQCSKYRWHDLCSRLQPLSQAGEALKPHLSALRELEDILAQEHQSEDNEHCWALAGQVDRLGASIATQTRASASTSPPGFGAGGRSQAATMFAATPPSDSSLRLEITAAATLPDGHATTTGGFELVLASEALVIRKGITILPTLTSIGPFAIFSAIITAKRCYSTMTI
ncbi:hypothetical protein C8T65DRAFT_745541 [Cerioporus squamosus]|nr:hypothetical protein C8T65DRAFT_745541 [Cerioporus squamosus]